MDTYNNFAELARNTEEGQGFCVRLQNRPGTTVVIVPHGGGLVELPAELEKSGGKVNNGCES